jgi:hypothetical protein
MARSVYVNEARQIYSVSFAESNEVRVIFSARRAFYALQECLGNGWEPFRSAPTGRRLPFYVAALLCDQARSILEAVERLSDDPRKCERGSFKPRGGRAP